MFVTHWLLSSHRNSSNEKLASIYEHFTLPLSSAGRFHNKWVSLLGTLLCISVMVLMDFRTAIATLLCIVVLWTWIRTRK